MIAHLEHVEVGTRVSYQDAANPRREGRVEHVVDRTGNTTPRGLPLPEGTEYVVLWDDGQEPFTTTSDLRQHGWHVLADLPGSPFDGADVISAYTRADAIRDGVLIPTTDLVPDEPDFAREAGWAVPVCLTTAAANLVIPTGLEAQDAAQSVKGRLWDVLHMAAMYGARRDASELVFPCIFWLAGAERRTLRNNAGPKTLHLKAVMGPDDDGSPVLTIMLPEED